jgi:lysophospholipase L1-like esterase
VSRILCLGGSTTYGYGVDRPEEAYPALLQKMLSSDLPAPVKGIEVINGGIPSGTTAEMLTHYQFKFHYYRPDLVILNPGGNDARAFHLPHYHPDYSHSRRQILLPQPLPPRSRILLRSRLFSMFVILILHGPYPSAGQIFTYEGRPPPAQWYSGDLIDKNGKALPSVNETAFYHNLNALLDQIRKDGAKALLVPFRSNPDIPYWPLEGLVLEEKVLELIARDRGLMFARFPAETISRQNWQDDCHLLLGGEREKAGYLLPFVRDLLWKNASAQ